METINEGKLDTELMLVTANVGSLFEDVRTYIVLNRCMHNCKHCFTHMLKSLSICV